MGDGDFTSVRLAATASAVGDTIDFNYNGGHCIETNQMNFKADMVFIKTGPLVDTLSVGIEDEVIQFDGDGIKLYGNSKLVCGNSYTSAAKYIIYLNYSGWVLSGIAWSIFGSDEGGIKKNMGAYRGMELISLPAM